MSESEVAKAVPHEELCDAALKHYSMIVEGYDKIVPGTALNSLVPAAIEYYKRWVPTGERKIVRTPGALQDALEEGWMFDPWLNPMGRAAILSEDASDWYWILVRGTPEQIEALEPFVDLPEDEEEEPPKPVTEADRLALAKDFVEIKPPDEPGVIPEKYAGWTIFKATKGNLQLILPREEKE